MIGFIGLGIMGSRMVKNLLNEGFEVTVHNRTKEKADELINHGAEWADTPKACAEQSDVLFTMLANPEAVKRMANGENGFLNGLKKDKLWVDSSTVNPSFTKDMAAEAEEHGIRFVDSPAAGSKIPAEKGELVFLVGGKDEDVEEIKPFLNAMGKAVNHVGESSKGTSMKMVVNLMLAQSMEAFSEAVTLGEALGLKKEQVLDTLVGGPTAAPFLAGKRDKLLDEDFEVEFPLEHMRKDLHLAAECAYENNISLPVLNVSKEVYGLAVKYNLGDQDFSAVYRLLNKR